MSFYTKDNISSCEIAGAVAEAALHDLRVNLFSFSGFPQIHVDFLVDDKFKITLSWNDKTDSSTSILLDRNEAKAAVIKFRKKTGYDKLIFERVQSALSQLEGLSRSGVTK